MPTNDYLKRILLSRVYDVAVETALEPAVTLSRRLGNKVLLKREDTQPVFSFKIRGAYNKMVQLSREELSRGVIAASAGNHAQGVALSAAKLGCEATIVMPETSPAIKVSAVRRLGGQVVLSGESFSDCMKKTRELIEETGAVFIPPFDDEDVIAGQGTIGMEILRQNPGPLDAVFVPIGGGGLAAGVAVYIKQLRPEVKVIGVEPVDSDDMRRSIAAGRPVEMKEVGLFADGVAVKRVGDKCFELCRECLDDIILVDTDAICGAIKDIFEDTRVVAEPAGALSLAGLKAYAEANDLHDKTLCAAFLHEPRKLLRGFLRIAAVDDGGLPDNHAERIGDGDTRAGIAVINGENSHRLTPFSFPKTFAAAARSKMRARSRAAPSKAA